MYEYGIFEETDYTGFYNALSGFIGDENKDFSDDAIEALYSHLLGISEAIKQPIILHAGYFIDRYSEVTIQELNDLDIDGILIISKLRNNKFLIDLENTSFNLF